MNIYEKIQLIKEELLEANLKRTGENKFAGFKYYELADIIPTIIQLCNAHKVFTYVNKIINRFFAENGRTPYPEEIQQILKDDYNIILSNKEDVAQFVVSSIDAKFGSDDEDGNTMAESGLFAMSTASNDVNNNIEQTNAEIVVLQAEIADLELQKAQKDRANRVKS